jgi:hypothetical protein
MMSATSYGAIRARQLELVAAIESALLPDLAYRVWEGSDDPDFPAWADSAGEAFRVIEIVSNLDYARSVFLGEGVQDVAHTELVIVAYPRLLEFAGHRLELVIDQDIHDLNAAIGQEAYARYVDGQHNCKLAIASVVDLQTVRILRATFLLEYHRSVPT